MSRNMKIILVSTVVLVLVAVVAGVVTAVEASHSRVNGPVVGSFEHPVPLGQEGLLGSWSVAITEPMTPIVESGLGDVGLPEAPRGTTYYRVEVTTKNTEAKASWFVATYAFAGPRADAYYPVSVVSSGADATTDAYPGDQVHVTLVFSVPEDQLPDPLLIARIDGGERFQSAPPALFFTTR